MNSTTKVRIVYECSTIGLVLLTFLKVMIPSIQTWWQIALVVSFVGLWFSLSYLKRHNYKWGFNYIENHLYIHLLLKVQKMVQNVTIIVLLISVFFEDLLYNGYCLMIYILIIGIFIGRNWQLIQLNMLFIRVNFIGNKVEKTAKRCCSPNHYKQ